MKIIMEKGFTFVKTMVGLGSGLRYTGRSIKPRKEPILHLYGEPVEIIPASKIFAAYIQVVGHKLDRPERTLSQMILTEFQERELRFEDDGK